MKIIYFYLFTLSFFISCKENTESSNNLYISNNTEQIFQDTIGNYSTLILVKHSKSVAYNFKNYIGKDSAIWSNDYYSHRIICFYHEKKNKIKHLIIENYRGKIPDSLDFTELNSLDINNSFITNDLFEILKKTKLNNLNIDESFVCDSSVDIKNLKFLKKISLHDNYTNFKISGYMPIKEILYRDVLENKFIKDSNTKLNFDKLIDLDSLYIFCNNCIVDIPIKKLERLRIKDNLIDTLYDKENK